MEDLDDIEAQIDQLKNKILILDIYHSNLTLRMENLDQLVQHGLNQPATIDEPEETEPPPAKIPKSEIKHIYQNEKNSMVR